MAVFGRTWAYAFKTPKKTAKKDQTGAQPCFRSDEADLEQAGREVA